MSKDRPTITARMKVDCLLHRVFLQFGVYLKDFEGTDLKPGDPVVFDHVHGVGQRGPHIYENLRPAQKRANETKARRETRDHHHGRRLRGEVKGAASPPIASSRFEGARSVASNSFENRGRG